MKRKIILFTFIGILSLSAAPSIHAEEVTAGTGEAAAAADRTDPGTANARQKRRHAVTPAGSPAPGMQYRTVPGAQNRQTPRTYDRFAPGTQNPQTPGAYYRRQNDVTPGMTPGAYYRRQNDVTPGMTPGGARQFRRVTPGEYGAPADLRQTPYYGQNAAPRRPLLESEAVPGEIDIFRVKTGDTLWQISRKYKLRLEAVIDANPALKEPDLIYPGDKIRVPLDEKIDDNMTIGGAKYYTGNEASPAAETAPASGFEQEVLRLVNKERAKAGVAELAWSDALAGAARAKARDMSENNYFSHQSSVLGSPFDIMKAHGVTYKTAGENIAKGQKTAIAVMTAWMASSAHRNNILNPRFTEIGVGYSASTGGTTYWTQQFIGK
ncbi:MAG: CAP domain-containing protein [Firmicutes bacterium]|nr:CAP domain-containing protein [Bacillota bacterium]